MIHSKPPNHFKSNQIQLSPLQFYYLICGLPHMLTEKIVFLLPEKYIYEKTQM